MLQRLAISCTLAITSIGCLVNVSTVSNPDRYFDEARRTASAVAGQKGPARELGILIYDADDRKLVRLEIPIGLVRKLDRHHEIDWDFDFDFDFDDHDFCDSGSRGCAEARRKLRKYRGRDLAKLPLGPLVEVTEDDGERVFVYLR